MTQPEHLQPKTSDRGFNRLPEIPSDYGGSVRVYESSAAMQASIWLKAVAPVSLNDPEGPTVEAPIHLSVDKARNLAEQILWLTDHHYQGAPGIDEIVSALDRYTKNVQMEHAYRLASDNVPHVHELRERRDQAAVDRDEARHELMDAIREAIGGGH